jgi:hypothetical protein
LFAESFVFSRLAIANSGNITSPIANSAADQPSAFERSASKSMSSTFKIIPGPLAGWTGRSASPDRGKRRCAIAAATKAQQKQRATIAFTVESINYRGNTRPAFGNNRKIEK